MRRRVASALSNPFRRSLHVLVVNHGFPPTFNAGSEVFFILCRMLSSYGQNVERKTNQPGAREGDWRCVLCVRACVHVHVCV